MGEQSAIEWTDHTYNPWQGCHRVSAGCAHCYMYREKERYGQNPAVVVRSTPATFNRPLRWKEPAKVFTCSWSDFFIEEADPWRNEAWDIIRRTPHLTYQILTKRPENIVGRLPVDWPVSGYPNVWLGVSVEDQPTADARIPQLLQMSAAVRFVSYEPALGPLDLHPFGPRSASGLIPAKGPLHLVIVGGESGPKARPFDVMWAHSIIRQCRVAGIACFIKQLGAKLVHPTGLVIGAREPLRLSDRKGGDWAEWPAELRVREFPAVKLERERMGLSMGPSPAKEPYTPVSGHSCRQCGRPLVVVDGRSRNKSFCGDPCRMAWHQRVKQYGHFMRQPEVQAALAVIQRAIEEAGK